MYKHIKFFGVLILLAITSFAFTGCKEEGCTDPTAINYDEEADKDDGSCIFESTLKMHVHSTFNGSNFSYGSDFTLPSGRKIKLDIARFYMSNFRLVNGSTETPLADVYRQYVPTMEHYDLGTVNAGTYTGFRFDIGVDSSANFNDPSTWPDAHALSSSSSTHDHWSWNTGYVFMKLEGSVDSTAAMNGTTNAPFVYHVGTMNFLRTVDLAVNFTVPESGEGEVHLNVDIAKFFDGIDLTSEFDTHTMNNMPLAGMVADNIQSAIDLN